MDAVWLRRLMHLFWRFSRGQSVEIRIVACDPAGRVFLQQMKDGGWDLPGGILIPGSTARGVAKKALVACGIGHSGSLMLCGLHRDVPGSAPDHVAVYVVRNVTLASPEFPSRGGFHMADALPEETSAAARQLVTGALSVMR
jgi:hypothetical protein